MCDLNGGRLVLDNSGRDLVSVPNGPNDRDWLWATTDGALVAQAGALTDLGGGRYRFEGTALDTARHTGREGTEADLLAEIGTDLGWHFPVQPVEMPGGVSLTR